MSETAVDSLCPYCGVGCQVRYHLRDGHILWAEGIDGPANRGQLCVKGRFGCDHAHHPDRLVTPLIRREDAPKTPAPKDPYKQFREASWEEALDRAASGLLAIRDRCGADALGAFGTAKGSNEDAYLLQKLVRTGFGTNSVDHCARLCHASSVVALVDQIGAGGVTAGFMQCNNADAMMIVGANPCQNHPVAAAFFKRAARSGTTLIVVDPRYSEIADHAHIAITPKPGSDIALFNAMAHVIVEEGLLDHEFVAQRTTGFEAFRRSLRDFTPEAASERCGVGAEDIREAARAFGRARAAMIFWGMGVTQHVHGVANVRTLVNLGLVTGNIGRPGTGLHPLRGQNNVQGVCDMGLLPNFLPGYARVEDAGGRERFENAWGCALPECAGLTIVEMVNGAAEGAIKGLYFMGENPAMSDPDAGQVRAALCRLEHLVVQDIFMTETAWYAKAPGEGTRRLVDHPGDRAAPGPRLALPASQRGVGGSARPLAGGGGHSLEPARADGLVPVSVAGRRRTRRGYPFHERVSHPGWPRQAGPGRTRFAVRTPGFGVSIRLHHRAYAGALAHRRALAPQPRLGCDRAGAGCLSQWRGDDGDRREHRPVGPRHVPARLGHGQGPS
jgi:formate dehydrogenase major subunit